MLRTTVIAKTDWVRSTEILRHIPAEDLERLLASHKSMIVQVVDWYQGTIVKGEGDSFWIIFPSVTAAAQAGIDMQREFRSSQIGRPDSERIAMRVAIAVGDLLHRENDVYGVAMTLTARIEALTPADEIYLSNAAWLALNHAQVKTAFVDTVTLKDFAQPERIYRVEQSEDITVEQHQIVVAVVMGRFTAFTASHERHAIAHVLTEYESTTLRSITMYGGKLRSLSGDLQLLTFDSLPSALTAIDTLAQMWASVLETVDMQLPLRIGIHQGDYFLFRTYLFGDTVNRAVILTRIGREIAPKDATSITVVSSAVADALRGTPFEQRLELIDPDVLSEPPPAAENAPSQIERAYRVQPKD